MYNNRNYVMVKWLILSHLTLVIAPNSTLNRTKRWIMYPYGGQFKVVIGIAWPVQLGSKQSMSCTVNFQFENPVPQNVSVFHEFPPIVASRSLGKTVSTRKMSERMTAYKSIEEILNSYGMDGYNCLLRGICENAMDTIDHEGNGLLGELLHIFLSPDYGDGEIEEDLDTAYVDAQNAGYYGVDCFSLYPNCPYGSAVLDLISVFLS